jgi:DNA-binding MarR family transcriptional regulator
MLGSGLVEETGITDDERRRYYRITGFGRKVLAAEVARLRAALTAAREKGVLEGAHW